MILGSVILGGQWFDCKRFLSTSGAIGAFYSKKSETAMSALNQVPVINACCNRIFTYSARGCVRCEQGYIYSIGTGTCGFSAPFVYLAVVPGS